MVSNKGEQLDLSLSDNCVNLGSVPRRTVGGAPTPPPYTRSFRLGISEGFENLPRWNFGETFVYV